jgi:hypothetical protein
MGDSPGFLAVLVGTACRAHEIDERKAEGGDSGRV